jgi:uncharacterized repeat protein (TIGR03803 family)
MLLISTRFLFWALSGGVLGAALPSVAFAATETTVYSFKGGTNDGSSPNGLLDVNGLLYGTTSAGGSGGGTIFKLTLAGKETVLHSFDQNSSDGYLPFMGSALVKVGGQLYGTTAQGGAYGQGTIFSVTPAGIEKVLYSFQGGTDGCYPEAGLTNVGGTLYGTTALCGSPPPDGAGTLFKATISGAETVLYTFVGSDGGTPATALLNVGGTVYGTTSAGGSKDCRDDLGCGTVFSASLAGAVTTLHTFRGYRNGAYPKGLIKVGDKVYGTTQAGGSLGGYCGKPGCGTIFRLSQTDGAFRVLYSFQGGSHDGEVLLAGLTKVGATLYGTTAAGGASGYGTVFQATTAGAETVLYSFPAHGNFADPSADLINVGGVLYGTTIGGGSYNQGTVFKLVP